jgi:hypothetical protein
LLVCAYAAGAMAANRPAKQNTRGIGCPSTEDFTRKICGYFQPQRSQNTQSDARAIDFVAFYEIVEIKTKDNKNKKNSPPRTGSRR